MSQGIKEPKGREGVREFLKSKGKDPDKFLPKTPESLTETEKPEDLKKQGKNPESLDAGSDSSSETEKATEEPKNSEETLLSTDDAELSEEDKKKKKEILSIRQTEKEAQREASVQKRFDELTGQIKDLKSEKTQDKEKLRLLEEELKKLRNSVENNPGKIRQEIVRLEQERVSQYLQEDSNLPRTERREMSDEELEEWMVEDLVAAQSWLADRQLRRKEEREADVKKLNKPKEEEVRSADEVVRLQKESQIRAQTRHPELDVSKRMQELKSSGKSREEIQKILLSENRKLKVVTEILRENSDKYLLAPNGPELLVDEMERRMKGNGSSEEDDLIEEAKESERQRLANVDQSQGLQPNTSRRPEQTSVGSSEFEKENPALYQKQLNIWRQNFPKLSDKELRARLDRRLKERRSIGAY